MGPTIQRSIARSSGPRAAARSGARAGHNLRGAPWRLQAMRGARALRALWSARAAAPRLHDPPRRSAMVSLSGGEAGASLIRVRGLGKSYRHGSEEVHVLHGLDLDVQAGEFVAFMGPSGSGKTTLLNLIGGLDLPSAGSVSVGGQELSRLSRRQLAAWRARNVGFVFQLYNLIPVLTAFQNVELPLRLTALTRRERRRHVETALGIVGLADRMHHLPGQLSGGQEQRVAIARAIVADPRVVLCDEPTGDLDRRNADGILELLRLLVDERGATVLMVTHDPRAAERAQTLLHLEKGVLVEASGREAA
jgi:putative ABC transport system ATP-binding protein